MTDQQIPADDLRRFIARCRTAVNGRGSILLDELEALLPDPPRPTLADMTEEERAACQWMQADVEGVETRAVITYPNSGNELATLIDRRGKVIYASSNRVTPRPDLPRLEWPEATPTGPDHLAVGTVIESAADPRIDALPVGSILLGRDEEATTKRRWAWTGRGRTPDEDERDQFGPWTVLHIPKEDDQ